MKKYLKIILAALLAVSVFALSACTDTIDGNNSADPETTAPPVDFDVDPTVRTNYDIETVSGTPNTWSTKTSGDETTLTFSGLTADSVYKISGELKGNIVFNVNESYKIELELSGFTVSSAQSCPITALAGDEATITAKKGTVNYVFDTRDDVSLDETQYAYAIHSEIDLTIGGQGYLMVRSDSNNGIHTKDDLEVKKLSLDVKCVDNAIKGNDSVTITSGLLNLVSTKGDGIKTSNTNVSDKGNQRGNVKIEDGTVNIYSSCDGIDASYNAEISGNANVNIYTDKYSSLSEEITDVEEGYYYIKSSVNTYDYSVKYYNSDSDFVLKNANYETVTISRSGGRTTYTYFYKVVKPNGYDRLNVYAYVKGSQAQGQENDYAYKSDGKALNEDYDTIEVRINGNKLDTSWTNFTISTRPGGGGWGSEGNPDKGDRSTKGIKADNEVKISGGVIYIKSYDDAIHASNDAELENSETPLVNVTISGGIITISSNDDAIHADGRLTISGGDVKVEKSYEGFEGTFINISGGNVVVVSSDDGVNGSSATGEAVSITGGYLYVFAGGDGLDSNSRTQNDGMYFGGGKVVVISTSSNNSCIDTENGYKYDGGYVLGICPQGMTSETTKGTVNNGKRTTSSNLGALTTNDFVNIDNVLTVKLPAAINNSFAIYIGPNDVTISKTSSSGASLDRNGVNWKV